MVCDNTSGGEWLVALRWKVHQPDNDNTLPCVSWLFPDVGSTSTGSLLLCLFLFSTINNAYADIISVQPIQIRSTDGLTVSNSSRTLFEAETDKIWGQASIDVVFQPWVTYDNSTFLTISPTDTDTNSFHKLATVSGHGQSASSTTINMFFVSGITSSSGTIYGIGLLGGNGIAIFDAVFTASRIDTIAHELGHNLGLDHSTLGAGSADNLMTEGSSRTTPESIADIIPDGAGLDMLTRFQIGEAASSGFVSVPEPVSLLVLASFGPALLFFRRRECVLSIELE